MKKSVAIAVIIGCLALFTIIASYDNLESVGFIISNDNLCGTAHGGEFASLSELQASPGLCSGGSLYDGPFINSNGVFEWECADNPEQESEMTLSTCQAMQNDPSLCGDANGGTFADIITLQSAELCSLGSAPFPYPTTDGWSWTCIYLTRKGECSATKGEVDNSCDVADINKDGIVDEVDQGLLEEYYGTSIVCRDSNSWCYGSDLDKDGKVGLLDLSILSSCLGTQTSWQSACIDSDRGNNIFTEGGCFDNLGNEIYDTCGSIGIVESWCEYNSNYDQETCKTNTNYITLGVACPSGSNCISGACVVDTAECGTATTNYYTTLTRENNKDILCAKGNPSSVGSSLDDSKWEWSCSVIVDGYPEHSDSITCQAGKTDPSINLACGTASTSGETYSSVDKLKKAGLCALGGTPTDPYYGLENTWGWYCYNAYDTSQVVKCAAKRTATSTPADLECGKASTSGETYSNAGEVEIAGRCNSGKATAVGTSNTNPVWEWTCYDTNNPSRNIPCTALKTSTPDEEISCGPADKNTYSNEDDLINLKCNAGDMLSDFRFDSVLNGWRWTCSDESVSPPKYKNCEAYYDSGAHPYWRIGESKILTSADIGTTFELIWEQTGLTAGSTIIFEIFEQGSIYNIRTGSNAILERVDSTGDAIGDWTLTQEDWNAGSSNTQKEFFFNYSIISSGPNTWGITDMYWTDVDGKKTRKVEEKDIVNLVVEGLEFGTDYDVEIRNLDNKLFAEGDGKAQQDMTYLSWPAGRDKFNNKYEEGIYYFKISLDNGITWVSTKDGGEFERTYGELTVGDPSDCGNNKEEAGEECDGGYKCRTDCSCPIDYIDDPDSRGCIKDTGEIIDGECKWSYEVIGDCDEGDSQELMTYIAKDSYTLNNCERESDVIETCEAKTGLTTKVAIIVGIVLAFLLIGLTVYLMMLSKKEGY